MAKKTQKKAPEKVKDVQPVIDSGAILWGIVSRTGQDPETKQEYMMVTLGARSAVGKRNCKITREHADADFKRGALMYLVGHHVPVVILGEDKETGLLTGSRKLAQEQLKQKMLPSLASAKEMKGTILCFTNYGAYVEVNGVVGMLKNTDYSIDYSEIKETRSFGDTIVVKAKEVTSEGKVFWTVPEKFHREKPIEYDVEPNTAVVGTVQSVKNFASGVGVFVRIATGLDALCILPQNIEVEVGNRVAVAINSVEKQDNEFLPPRVRGRILRVI